MNEERSFERFVADNVAGQQGGAPLPDDFYDDMHSFATTTRQRPRWLALTKEPPMRTNNHLAVGSPTVRVAAVLVATMLLALTLAAAGIAGQRLLAASDAIVVAQDGSGDYATITEAVAMAEDGDTILVRPGTYDESVVLTKDITITGDGDREAIVVELSAALGPSNTVIEHDPDLPTAFLFEDSDARLEHLTVRGEPSRIVVRGGAPVLQDLLLDGLGRICCDGGVSMEPTGLTVMDASTATIKDNVILDTAIDFILDADPTVSGNEISGGGIWMQGEGVDPIIRENSMDAIGDFAVWGGAGPTVESNTITNSQDGIQVQDTGWLIPDTGTDPLIRGNTISGTNSTAIVVDSGEATIVDNTLVDNRVAISWRAGDGVISGNAVSGGDAGIVITRGAPATDGDTLAISDNAIEGLSGRGIAIGARAQPVLSGNRSCDNGENLWVADGAMLEIDDSNEICEDAATE